MLGGSPASRATGTWTPEMARDRTGYSLFECGWTVMTRPRCAPGSPTGRESEPRTTVVLAASVDNIEATIHSWLEAFTTGSD